MLIDFITVEDGLNPLVSFAIAPRAHRSLTLVRSLQFESVSPLHERGIRLCFDPREQEREKVGVVQWCGTDVTFTTAHNEYVLDVKGVSQAEISSAKAVLRRMVEGGAARFEDA